jgi:hypothetical protein
MPAPIIIEVTPQAQAVIVKLQRFPQEMGQAIKRGMDDAGNTAWREITIQRFSGKGPFPVPEHRLGSRTERLKQSLFYRAATIETAGSSVVVTGTMGSLGVKYFPVHEYGLTGLVPFKTKKGKTGTRKMNIPARAPMHHGIEDHRILFQQKIQQELEKTLNAKT